MSERWPAGFPSGNSGEAIWFCEKSCIYDEDGRSPFAFAPKKSAKIYGGSLSRSVGSAGGFEASRKV